jgi:pantoate--beta-alanine ligase
MILYKKAKDLRKWLDAQQKNGSSIGFAPTMGALHMGHISLVVQSKKVNDITVCSIFINPTQFNDPDDLKKYPVTIEKDIDMLEEAGVDVLFLPEPDEVYPNGLKEQRHYALGYLETLLEGQYRPGHFQGVCMVVDRLLEIVQPVSLYLGQKDYQQCLVLSRLLELTGRSGIVGLEICPTFREPDGLAMSSRNMRLTKAQREKAPALYQCLQQIKSELRPGKTEEIKRKAVERLREKGFKPDYAEIADAKNLEPVLVWDGKQKLVVLVAAFLDDIRLIDNLLLN